MKVNKGNIDAEDNDSRTRTEEKGFHNHAYARFYRGANREGEGARYQQERVNRADDSHPYAFLYPRTRTPGKILDQLIEKTHKQLAQRESEVSEIRTHLEELELLRGQLQQPEQKTE